MFVLVEFMIFGWSVMLGLILIYMVFLEMQKLITSNINKGPPSLKRMFGYVIGNCGMVSLEGK